MKAGIDPITEPVAAELLKAAARMTRRERALGDALIDTAGAIQTVYPLLDLLADSPDIGFGDQALIDEVRCQLGKAEAHAIGTHAAVVGELLGVDVH